LATAVFFAGVLPSTVCLAEPGRVASLAVNTSLPKSPVVNSALALPSNPTLEDLFRAHLFEEPLVPVGGQPSSEENAALITTLKAYSQRTSPDDFSSLTDFVRTHPNSPWRAALLTDLGLEYYNSAHYSLALDAFTQAWALAKDAPDLRAKALADRAVGE